MKNMSGFKEIRLNRYMILKKLFFSFIFIDYNQYLKKIRIFLEKIA